MSASPLIVAVLATVFGLGELGERPDDSEMDEWKQRQIDNWAAMRLDVWEDLGFCEPLKASGRDCGYDPGPACKEERARNKPCVFSLDNMIREHDRYRNR